MEPNLATSKHAIGNSIANWRCSLFLMAKLKLINKQKLILCVSFLVVTVILAFMYTQAAKSQALKRNFSFLRPVLFQTAQNNVNCSLLFKGDPTEITDKRRYYSLAIPSDDEVYKQATNCVWIRANTVFNFYMSKEEKNFSLAFAINVFESPYQIIRFLKVIYRPHNVYCIHYDRTSNEQFKELMIKIAECLPNVIIPTKIVDVIWGWHTIIDAQLSCMKDLYAIQHKYDWRYVITLCGKEVPLRTNREIVETLEKLNGVSAVGMFGAPKGAHIYWKYKHILNGSSTYRTKELLGPIPYNFTITKSMAYYGLSLKFVDYLLHNPVALEFKKFMDNVLIPDEHFVATLFGVPGVPGGNNPQYTHLIPVVSSYNWLTGSRGKHWQKYCNGWNVHGICIVSSGDLFRLSFNPNVQKTQVFFHNKFFIERDRVVIDCAESELRRRNLEEFQRDHQYTDQP